MKTGNKATYESRKKRRTRIVAVVVAVVLVIAVALGPIMILFA